MTDLSNIYFTTIVKKTVHLKPNKQRGDINDQILKYIQEEYEGICIEEGYVKPNSSKISKRTVLKLVPNILSGDMYCDVRIKAEICRPVKGNIIECSIDKINKMGLMAIEGPLNIAVPRSFHKDKDVFKDMEIGSKIKVEVIGSRFEINWDHIDVICSLYDPNKKQKKKLEMKIIESTDNTDLLEDMSDNENDVLEDDDNVIDEDDNVIDEDDDDDDTIIDDDDTIIDDDDGDGTIDDEGHAEEDVVEDVLLDEENLDEEGNMVGGDEDHTYDEEDDDDDEDDEVDEVESLQDESDYE